VSSVQSVVKKWLWQLLVNRSVAHFIWEPSRKNTIWSLVLIALAVPLAAVLLPFVILRKAAGRTVDVYLLKIHGEFGYFVEYMERVRQTREGKEGRYVVIVKSSFRHRGLTHLYQKAARCWLFWSTGPSVYLAQAVLLQPRFTTKNITLPDSYLAEDKLPEIVERPLTPTRTLIKKRQGLLKEMGCLNAGYVTMAVFTSTSSEMNSPEYRYETKWRESIGSQLASSVDFLKSHGLDVIMLGFPDAGSSHVPREFPRLTDFARIGGREEVALASGCRFLWNDHVGAQWLCEPFKIRSMITNWDSPDWLQRKFNYPPSHSDRFLVLPLRYVTKEGDRYSFERALGESKLTGRSCAGRAGLGELGMSRNSPEEITDGLTEMIQRSNGSWVDDEETRRLRTKLDEVFQRDGRYLTPPIASTFLRRHAYLVEP
jgi:putative glycosyltransferase (TIGR04372 family)